MKMRIATKPRIATCHRCKGDGYVEEIVQQSCDPRDTAWEREYCPNCDGTGIEPTDKEEGQC